MKLLDTICNHYRQCFGISTPHQGGRTDNNADSGPVPDRLERLFFLSNWKVDPREMPRFQILGAGDLIEPVTRSLTKAIGQKFPDARVGWSWDADNREGQSRPLRVIDRDAPGHLAATDIQLYQKSGDLFIGYSGRAWSKSRFWTRAFGFVILPTILAAIMVWVVTQDGFRKSWVRDFAKKHAGTGTVTYSHAGSNGASQSQSFTEVEPLENFILHGSAPAGEDVLFMVSEIMKNHPEHIEQYESVLTDYLKSYEHSCLNLDTKELARGISQAVGGGNDLNLLSNLGVFPIGATANYGWSESGPVPAIRARPFGIPRTQLVEWLKSNGARTQLFWPENNQFVNKSKTLAQAISGKREADARRLEERTKAAKRAEANARYRAQMSPYGSSFSVPATPPDSMQEYLISSGEQVSGALEIEERADLGGSRFYGWKADTTPGLTKEENQRYYDARVELGRFSNIQNVSERQIAFEKDPKFRELIVTWVILGHKTRIPKLREFEEALASRTDGGQGYVAQVIANLLYFGLLTHDFDGFVERLPPQIQRDFKSRVDALIEPPWSTFKLLNKDWLLFLAGPMKVPVMIFAGLMALALFLPKSALRGVCSFMKWPAPQTFDHAISAQNTSIQGLVSMLLRKEFRITEDRIIKISR
jgi:hypothetical protein